MEELSVTQPLPEADLEVNDILAAESPPRQYIRIVYAKTELIKFISHHDEFRLWERTLRRADLPLLYKQGFNPQPHMQFASAIGRRHHRRARDAGHHAQPARAAGRTAQRARSEKPVPGVRLVSVTELDKKPASVQGQLMGADYTILIYAAPGEIEPAAIVERIQGFLAQDTIGAERERKGEAYTYNLRPLIFQLYYHRLRRRQ